MAPLIAAALRIGAGLAARVGASGVARSLVAAARTAGPAGARRAAIAAAASRGSAAAATSAAEQAVSAGIRGRAAVVLEDTPLTNAKAMFQAINGQTPSPTVATSAAAQAAPGAQVQAAAAAAPQPSMAAAAPVPPGSSVPTSAGPPPVQAGATPPSNPRPQTLLDKAVDAFHRAKATYAQAQARFTPIADQVANLTLDQRYSRLDKAGKLPNIGDVARQFGTPNPSREQIVQHGEADEERQRQEAIQQSRSAQVGQAAWSAGKRTLVGAMNSISPAGIATAPAWMYGIITGFERLGKTLSETNRDLSQFDDNIAESFARLDYTQLRSRRDMAHSTSGSASFLNDQLTELMRELQPMRQALASFANTLAGIGVWLARGVNLLMALYPQVALSVKAMEELEKRMRETKDQESEKALKDFMRSIRDGTFSMPENKKPRR